MGLLAQGTVFQGFCALTTSLGFLAVHMRCWPYPFAVANCFKAFADLQTVLVILVGVLVHIDEDVFDKDRFGKDFYGTVLLALIVFQTIGILVVVLRKSRTEQVLSHLQKYAELIQNLKDDGTLQEPETCFEHLQGWSQDCWLMLCKCKKKKEYHEEYRTKIAETIDVWHEVMQSHHADPSGKEMLDSPVMTEALQQLRKRRKSKEVTQSNSEEGTPPELEPEPEPEPEPAP